MPRPGCVKCCVEMKPEKNDVTVELMAGFGSYQLWLADLWKCPKCGYEILTGYGAKPWGEHFEGDYKNKLEMTQASRITLTNVV